MAGIRGELSKFYAFLETATISTVLNMTTAMRAVWPFAHYIDVRSDRCLDLLLLTF